VFQDRLNSIAEFIFQHNSYFDAAFPYVAMNETKGYVSEDETIVFPNDNLGDYFYLRLPKNVSFQYSNDYKYNNCKDGIASRTEVVLVAIVKGGSPDILLSNMIDSLRAYRQEKITLKSAIYQKEYVLLQELANIKPESQEAALQRLPESSAFVSIAFEIIEGIVPSKIDCLPNPCTCSTS